MFPQIVYADSAVVYTSRNRAVHPIYLIPACIPLSERLKRNHHYLWGYLPKDVPILQCIKVLGNLCDEQMIYHFQ